MPSPPPPPSTEPADPKPPLGPLSTNPQPPDIATPPFTVCRYCMIRNIDETESATATASYKNSMVVTTCKACKDARGDWLEVRRVIGRSDELTEEEKRKVLGVLERAVPPREPRDLRGRFELREGAKEGGSGGKEA